MRITLSHREGRFGAFGLGKKVHFVDVQIDFSPDEMEVVRARRLDKYHLITGGDDQIEYQVKNFMGRTMTVRFADFLSAQAFEQQLKGTLANLKTALEAGAAPTNRTSTFEL